MNLGRYEVVRELGKGAMGIVYLAKDPLIGRLVALKTIRVPATTDDEETREFQQRFIREAQAAGILNHPAIVTVHDIGQDDESGMSFIAMEYVDGPNLKEILQQGKPIEFSRVGEMLAQVAEALDFAHSKGIVHRDVKPANIILCGEDRVKITDFGIAKIASSKANLTSTGQFLGTPNYMSPEQIKGIPVDGRTDIFSLGIVLYEALTRRKPFGGDSLTSISYKIVHEHFLPMREVNPSIPEAFEPIAERCLAKEPARRYQRGRDLAADLRRAGRGELAYVRSSSRAASRDPQEKVPTTELPFPEAAEPSPRPVSGPIPLPSRSGQSSGSIRMTSSGEFRAVTAPVKPLGPPFDFEKFFRSLVPKKGWRTEVPPIVFAGVIAVALLAFAFVALSITRQKVDVPQVDVAREHLVMHQRALRLSANEDLRAGRVDDAYAKYTELRKTAPNSVAAAEVIAKLDRIKYQAMSYRQRLEQANQLLEQGKSLFDQQKYEEAIPYFEEAFHLNPNLDAAVEYLRQTRQAVEAKKSARRGPILGRAPAPRR